MTFSERPTPNRSARGKVPVDLIVLHTQEGDSTADNLGAYLQQPKVQASYHRIIDKDGNECRGVPDGESAWAAGPIANSAGLHVCLTGYASWTRAQWLARPAQLDGVARVIATWARERGIPLAQVSAATLASPAGGSGVCGHDTTAQAWHETNHTDPGAGLPRDLLLDKARAINGGTPAPAPEDDDMSAWDTKIDNLANSEVPAGAMLAWVDKHTRELWDVRPTGADYAYLGEPEPGERVTFNAVDAIFNADARAYEARQMSAKALAATERVERQNVAILAALAKLAPKG